MLIGFTYDNISHLQPKSQNHNKNRVLHNQIQKSGNVTHHTNTSFSRGINLRALYIAASISNTYTEKYTTTQIKVLDDIVGTFFSQVVVVSSTQFISSFSHITPREVTEKSRYKRNYSIGVSEN